MQKKTSKPVPVWVLMWGDDPMDCCIRNNDIGLREAKGILQSAKLERSGNYRVVKKLIVDDPGASRRISGEGGKGK